WLSDEPFVHICGKRYVDRAEDVTKITVYSNQPEVELFANGKSLGRQKCGDHFFRFDVPVSPETKLHAVAGECTDDSFIRRTEKFNEDYRLKEKGAVLNWFDITEREGYFSLNDKMGDVMKSPEGMMLFAGLMKEIMASGGQGGGMMAGFEMSEGMMQMMGGFTIIRLTNLIGTAGIKLTKEQLLGLNAKLNQIKKP
ncbi:MAG: DUF4982 domain-containing protein, partial [Acutalibacteraceae bacterium]